MDRALGGPARVCFSQRGSDHRVGTLRVIRCRSRAEAIRVRPGLGPRQSERRHSDCRPRRSGPSARSPSRRCLTGSCGLRGCRRRLGKVNGDRTAGGLSHLARSTRAGPFAHPDAEISSFYSRGGVAFGALASTRGNRSRDLSSADHSAARALGQLRRSHGRTWPWSTVAHRCRGYRADAVGRSRHAASA